MKPRELITHSLQQIIEPILSDRGFAFSASSLKFSKVFGDFKQEIHTHLNRHNMEGISAEFWFSFAVSSSKYSKWHKAEYGDKPTNNYLASEMYWNIKGWKYPKPDLAISQNIEKDMAEILEDTLLTGLPFLEKYSNWANAAIRFTEENWFHDKACDFFLISGDKEKAYWCLQKAIECWKKFPKKSFFVGEKEGVLLRFEKHFGESVDV
jgi:hypothetical protein